MAEKQKGKVFLRPSKTVENFDDTPLWNHVKVIQLAAGGGGNRTWLCNYCNKKVTGSYYKVKGHLLKLSNHGVEACKQISSDVYAVLKLEHEQAESKKLSIQVNARKKSDYISLPEGSDLEQQKKRKGAEGGGIEKAFNLHQRNTADKLAARMFYASGLSFNLANSPYFKKYSKFLADNPLAGYTPPTYNRLRTSLLSQEKMNIMTKLQPIKDSWKKKGLSICSDGWSDVKRRPLINIMAASSGGPIFLNSINSSGIVKDGDYVANLFVKAIEGVGSENVVQVITDNASNMKLAGSIVEQSFPHIFWTPCVVHCLNLALKSMCQPSEKSTHYKNCKWMVELISQMNNLKNFVVNHDIAHSIFKKYSDLCMLRVAETRFASHIIMADRFQKVKKFLEQMVMDDEWKHYKGDKVIEAKTRDIKSLIMKDEWWDKVDFFLEFTKPILSMLRNVDLDCPSLHLIYDMWDTMTEKVKKIIFEHEGKDLLTGQSDFFDTIHGILEARWNKSNTPLHCMAHSLVPKYYHETWLKGENGIRRFPPNEDSEISFNRVECFRRYFRNSNEFKKVSLEYGAFCSGSGYFGEPHVIEAMMYEEPLSWWANHGVSAPLLQKLAFKLLSQPASSSCCERNWSTYSMIHNIKRNKLTTTRAEDLVFVHYNIRFLSRKKEKYTSGPSKFWDLGGDHVDIDIDETSNSLLELSMNEPQLEGVIFGEEFEDLEEVEDMEEES
ncbi:uncharacterized protein LOC132629044 [Lycium barbarum]|uniref:uncharacterized protein LOC132629044 n=1 Tax=Lycium barbarum TaxID=112863 RepID=UPI00293EABEE|nr:uncharacterized protein LOC132629044 [Lycium barbarum]